MTVEGLLGRAGWLGANDNNFNLNANDNLNNTNAARGIAHHQRGYFIFFDVDQRFMANTELYEGLCSYENLFLAFKRARKGKTTKDYVLVFERDLTDNLLQLRTELLFHSYLPKPLQNFILRDPKTRKISKSDFRDRIIHHALCNVIEPFFEKQFIYDSYANRVGKGTLRAIRRFDQFKRKVSHNLTRNAFVFKADIRHYFETVDHQLLLSIIQQTIKDQRVLWLIKIILDNYHATKQGKGMPLGNLTSQFFANIYLNELDRFVKHILKTKYYIRYVDDFVILECSREKLEDYRWRVDLFLQEKLTLKLHPDKSRIIPLQRGTEFLGLKIFSHHKLLKQKNLRKFYQKRAVLSAAYDEGTANYDTIYDFLEGWLAYAKQANTYTLRQKILTEIEQKFPQEISTKEVNKQLKWYGARPKN